MKNLLKRSLAVLLTVVMLLTATPLNESMFKAKAQSPYLTDAQIARYINLFYVPGSEAAQAAESILNGQSEGTVAEIKEICSNIGLFLGIAADVEIDNMTIQALGDLSVVTNAIVGVFNIIDNYQQMQSTQSALKKTVDGMQIAVSFLQVINLGSYISPSISMALSVIDVTMNIAGYLEMQEIKEAVELYRAELMLDYYAGNELTFRTATDVSGLGISQETADSLYSAAYFEWYFKQCMDRIGNNTGEDIEGSEPESKPVESVVFAADSYTMFFNSTLTNTAVVYPADADDSSIKYYSRNTSVATVDSNGVVKPVSPGTVNIVAEASNGVYDVCTLTILPYIASVDNGEFVILSYVGNERNVTIPSYIDKNVNGKYIVGIGENAFRGCESITSVKIPETVSVIGDCAFAECPNLKSVVIPNSVTTIEEEMFFQCNNLKSVTLPENLKRINERAFFSCSSLENISLPNSITTIGEEAFWGCGINNITIPNSVTTIADGTFGSCSDLESVTIPDGVTTIGNNAFMHCSSLTNIIIPDSVTNIGVEAFHACFNLKSVKLSCNIKTISDCMFNFCQFENITIPDGVTTIGRGVFGGCTSLNNVTIPNSVTTIGDEAFVGCSSLTSITIPDSVTSIGSSVFMDCYELESITVDADNECFSSDSYGALFNKRKTEIIQYPIGNKRTSYIIPNSVITVGDYSFYNGTALTSVTIPDSVETIGSSAFDNCTSLASVSIPNSVTTIAAGAFYGCTNLATVTVGNSVTNIGYYAFRYCSSLMDVYCRGSKTEWNAINIGNYNECLTNATIHYNHVCAYVDWDVTEPTSTEFGYKTGKCVCRISEGFVIPATGFDVNEDINIDFVDNLISGFNVGKTSLDDYAEFVDAGYEWRYETLNGTLGTGSKAVVTDGENIISEYTVVIFGDIDGNGWYDANDAFLVRMLEVGLLTREAVGEAVYKAADCNHDGVVDGLDVELLERASVLLDNVNQSATQNELVLDSSYIAYCSVIDQSADIEADSEPEKDTVQPPVETQPESDMRFDIEAIFRFIFSIFEKMFTVIISLIG